MTKTILILFGILTAGSTYLTYQGVGLQGVESVEQVQKSSVRTSSHGSFYGGNSGGFGYGK